MVSDSALRSAGTLLSRVRAPRMKQAEVTIFFIATLVSKDPYLRTRHLTILIPNLNGEWVAHLVGQLATDRRSENRDTREAIKKLLDAKDFVELRRLLMHRMEFGTAGLRTRMGPGNSQMNDLTIIQTTQGLVKYLKETLPDSTHKGVVVGFDGRHNSHKWSKIVATICVNADIPVYLFERFCPTPYVAFALRTFDASCGIMITASHNPKEDNGYKVYWDNGAQIIPPHDVGISEAINKSLQPMESSWDTSVLKNESKKSLIINPMDDVIQKYNEAALAICYTRETNSECPVRFTYTAMHGVGHEFVCHTMKAFDFQDLIPVVEQVKVDPDFPTVKYPNPEEGEGALKLAMETADKNRSKVILANDPDADRLAVAEKTERLKFTLPLLLNIIPVEIDAFLPAQQQRIDTHSKEINVKIIKPIPQFTDEVIFCLESHAS
ncbi:phosphoglucomutase-2 [Plakobranchus ocellatus]|uniref:Phosphoglucomutase-2 n=1 Tax=Plakobranchus ocellatus TaxID=259542 RepID=A0AAV4BFN3_9GAST|nr:phosphoglucomutase-2 [Plakobranchus ocellatus]